MSGVNVLSMNGNKIFVRSWCQIVFSFFKNGFDRLTIEFNEKL